MLMLSMLLGTGSQSALDTRYGPVYWTYLPVILCLHCPVTFGLNKLIYPGLAETVLVAAVGKHCFTSVVYQCISVIHTFNLLLCCTLVKLIVREAI
jgi:hypothetical protein